MYPLIPTILRSDELLDKALGRSSKIVKEDRVAFYRARKTTLAQLESVRDILLETLEKYVKRFPNLDKVDSYERELIDVVVGADRLKNALARIDGSAAILKRVSDEYLRRVARARESPTVMQSKRSAIGRLSSMIDDLSEPLLFLGHAREVLRAIPEVTPGDPTIVLAGYPNVGKSSLLARLSRARPEIAPYAFTTKSANIGHFHWPETGPEHRRKRHQLVDTPGLLEQPPEKRNAIEQQAALALRFLADVIVFILDPSEACGYTLGQQEGLLEQVRREFPGAPMLVVENKSDLKARASGNLPISCETGDGIAELRRRIVDAVPIDKYQDLIAGDAARS